jgi:hypothetical protein
MSVVGIEKDVEKALRASIVAKLTTDSIAVKTTPSGAGTSVTTWTGEETHTDGGADRTTADPPLINIVCDPVDVKKAGSVWEATVSIEIRTQAATAKDRTAVFLASLVSSVGACLDYTDHSTHTERVASLRTIRNGGSHESGDHNVTYITCRALICGTKAGA